ncbi:hypothetical protein [Leptospira sp. B5-022]|uniref:hypothetical protein n=2 Tax=unclassified Leptospira TaxID=2633828 RepID=UPI0002BD705A|nr:hypothetical protein [Leptospira sp. B5-022]EMK01208.1 hypothetical protein LEP1GSC192_1156 [Leptospira sp. B5-022]
MKQYELLEYIRKLILTKIKVIGDILSDKFTYAELIDSIPERARDELKKYIPALVDMRRVDSFSNNLEFRLTIFGLGEGIQYESFPVFLFKIMKCNFEKGIRVYKSREIANDARSFTLLIDSNSYSSFEESFLNKKEEFIRDALSPPVYSVIYQDHLEGAFFTEFGFAGFLTPDTLYLRITDLDSLLRSIKKS